MPFLMVDRFICNQKQRIETYFSIDCVQMRYIFNPKPCYPTWWYCDAIPPTFLRANEAVWPPRTSLTGILLR